jgi:hypothetical protein
VFLSDFAIARLGSLPCQSADGGAVIELGCCNRFGHGQDSILTAAAERCSPHSSTIVTDACGQVLQSALVQI